MPVSAEQVIEVFGCATEENQRDPYRQHQLLTLPAQGDVMIAGDIHDNRRNFERLLAAADITNNPQRHLILQELIHGDHLDANGAEGSWEILYRAAELKCDHPSQIHFLLANHDLAQIHGEGIMKAGASVCEAFNAGIKRDFGPDRYKVQVALTEFLLSFPLGIRCPNGVFFCHSLPTDAQIDTFDYTVFTREVTGADYRRKTGPAYQLVWGRHTTPMFVDKFAEALGAKVFVTGHQPQETGYTTVGDKQLIIASEHNQGVFLTVDLAKEYDIDMLVGSLRKFVSVEV
jgi:hypothetical protein